MAKMNRKSLADAAAAARTGKASRTPQESRGPEPVQSLEEEPIARPAPAAEARASAQHDPLAERIRQLRQEKQEVRPPAPKRLNVNLEPDLYDAFQEACSRTGRKMSEVVRDLVEAFVRS